MLLLALLTPLFAQTTDPHVVVPPEVLLGEEPPPPELAPAKSVVAWARTTLTPVEGELKVTQELRFEVAKPGWVFVPVLDGRVANTPGSAKVDRASPAASASVWASRAPSTGSHHC